MSVAYQDNRNLLKLTTLSYFFSFVCGVMVIIPFLIKVPAAHYFRSTLAQTGYIFSFFMVGMVLAQYLNGFLVRFLSIRAEVVLIAVVYAINVYVMFLIHNITWMIVPLIFVGFCAGITTTLPNFIIVHAFHGYRRSSRLNRLDFFFSMGSFVYPMLATVMLMHHWSWLMVYLSVLFLFVVIVALSVNTVFPDFETHAHTDHVEYSKWNLNVCLVAVAILAFFLSYVGFTYWLEPYLQVNLKLSVKESNFALSLFWIFYAVGCLISSVAVKYVRLNSYILSSLFIALFSYITIYLIHNYLIMEAVISILGLGCATVYSSGISFGTHQVVHASPRVVALYITCSGIGTLFGESYSSYIESHAGFFGVVLGSLIMLTIAIALFAVVALRNYRHHSYCN